MFVRLIRSVLDTRSNEDGRTLNTIWIYRCVDAYIASKSHSRTRVYTHTHTHTYVRGQVTRWHCL